MYVHNIILYIRSRVYYYKEIIGDYCDYHWIIIALIIVITLYIIIGILLV